MALTFQTALYFTIVGLSFAASIARNVRWCTISDIEQKKCNDLVVSCKVPDITLVCVHRSSIENCKAAIKNKHADAMFLDSGEIYKALMEPYSSQRDLTKCLKQRQEALGGDKKVIGGYIPHCDEKGNYHPKQCHGSTGYCWCVNANGEKINGTNTPPGQKPPTCQSHDLTKCLKQRQEALGGDKMVVGRHIPECDEKGNYHPKQCHASTGNCWCVNAIGEKIDGTNTARGQKPPTCQRRDLTKCLKERLEALGGDEMVLGRYIPQCDEKGDYHPKQCHGSTGYCWCVNAIGEKIDGTNTAPGQKPPTCQKRDLTKCLKERQEAMGGDEMVIGRYIPQCDEKGNHHPKQCHGSTGYCWCVNANGEKINGTNTPPGQKPPTCQSHDLTKCLKQRQEALGGDRLVVGRHIPECDEKGNYHPKQCHASTGNCWCVNANGEKINGTNTARGQKPPTCQSHDLTKCLKERQEALGGDKLLVGRHIPECDEKGHYHPKQCHASTGNCWCVNANGEKIDGTNTARGQKPPTCQSHDLKKCLKQRQEALGGDKLVVGRYIPHCDEKGDYHPKQCHDSTGYCWCVNANGEKIDGTNTAPGQTPPTCQSHELTKCLKQRQEALGGDKMVKGRYIPECDEKGNYHPKQCHASTGYCWCVNANGEKINGTDTPPGQTRPTCQSHDLKKCLKQRQEALGGDKLVVGRYIPHCDEKGDYHPKQCHDSTGYCWCVNANGEKIDGTNTARGQTPPTCQSHELTKCLKQRQEALGGDKMVKGRYIPECDEKGNYHPKQCHASTGYCWCVNANGEKINGTDTPPGQTRPTCQSHELTKCMKQRLEALGGDKMVIGGYIPQCDEKGNYHPKQCHGSTGYCWCVIANGEKIDGTNTAPGQKPLTCQSHEF